MSKAYEAFVSDVLDTIAEMRSTGDFDENTLETLEWKLSPPHEDWDKCRLSCVCEPKEPEARVFKIGVAFEFYPDTDHADMFTDDDGEHIRPTNDEVVSRCKDLAFEDISNLVYRGELFESLTVEVDDV